MSGTTTTTTASTGSLTATTLPSTTSHPESPTVTVPPHYSESPPDTVSPLQTTCPVPPPGIDTILMLLTYKAFTIMIIIYMRDDFVRYVMRLL